MVECGRGSADDNDGCSVICVNVFWGGGVYLPTGSSFFAVLSVAVVGVGGGAISLWPSLLPLSLSHRRCSCCCCIVIVVIGVVAGCQHYCHRFSFFIFHFSLSLSLLLSSSFSIFVVVIVSLWTPFRSVVLPICGFTTVIVWRWQW